MAATPAKPLEPLEFGGKVYKVAWMWVIPHHPSEIGFPGVHADLFFSSPEAFARVLGRDASGEVLAPTWVEADFNCWDFIPEDY